MTERNTRILGKMLSQYIGKSVIVAGHLTKISSCGTNVEVVTFDNITVNVTLPNPLEIPAEGILEVWGTVKSKGTIEAVQSVHFEEDKEFDPKAYNDLLIIQNAKKDERWMLNKSTQPL